MKNPTEISKQELVKLVASVKDRAGLCSVLLEEEHFVPEEVLRELEDLRELLIRFC